MEAFVDNAWKGVTGAEAFIGGGWRNVVRAEAYIDGQWRTVLSFAPPLTVQTPSEISGYRSAPKPTAGTVTAYVDALPNGGTAPYKYQWVVVEGSVSLGNPNSAGTSVSAYLPAETDTSGIIQVTCTDANGIVAVSQVMFYLYNQSEFIGR